MKRSPLAVVFLVLFGVLLFAGARQTLTDLERATQARSLIAGISSTVPTVVSEKQASLNAVDLLIAAINAVPPPPPPPQETCNADGTGNGVDEDGDGQVDEGCTVPTPTPTPTPGTYPDYEGWCKLPGATCYAFRTQAEIDRYKAKTSYAAVVKYDAQKDAAKVVIQPNQAQLTNQERMPTGHKVGQSLLVVWDGLFDQSWINGGIPDQKTFQLASGTGCPGQIHTEERMRYGQGNAQKPGSVAKFDVRQYPVGGYSVGPNVTLNAPLAPTVGQFFIMPNVWTRWIIQIKQPASGSVWYRYSSWLADRNTGPVQVHKDLEIRPAGGTQTWSCFWLEFNTSTNTRSTKNFPLTAWIRNIASVVGPSADNVGPFLKRP